MLTYEYVRTIRVGDIYFDGEIPTPEGYEDPHEFRPPVDGDIFIRLDNLQACMVKGHAYGPDEPRLIIKKKKKKKYLVHIGEFEIVPDGTICTQNQRTEIEAASLAKKFPQYYHIEER